MIRLLVVDDEKHIVDWLFEIFTEEFGYEIEIFKAYTGYQALDLMKKAKIDIVLTDIRMPVMNGLELVGKIHESWPHCKVIFLTGYNEFDYAYKAIELGTASFLLKTEDDDRIILEVKKVIETIKKELQDKEIIHLAKQQETMRVYLLQKELFADILSGMYSPFDVGQERFRELDISLNISMPVILLMGRIESMVEGYRYSEYYTCQYTLKLLMEKYLSYIIESVQLDLKQCKILWILQPKKSNIEHESFDWKDILLLLRENLQTIQSAYKELLSGTVSFAVLNEPVAWKDIASTFNYFDSVMNYKMGLEKSVLLTCSVAGENDNLYITEYSDSVRHSHAQLKKTALLESYLENGQKYEFFMLLGSLVNCLKEVTSKHYIPAMEIYYAVSLMFLSYINRWRIIEQLSFKIGIHKLTRINELESWNEGVDYLFLMGDLIFDIQEKEQKSKNMEIIDRVKSHVLENLGGDLSLTHIAECVNYNPSYLSRLFKQVYGQNLFEYISDARINKAKELLKTDNTNVNQIAKSIGFDSSQYFSTFFKKRVNMTPQEYRDTFITSKRKEQM